MTLVTLTGHLGRDREIRATRERTYTARYFDDVAEQWTESEVTPPTRDYALLSLATASKRKGRHEVTWHRVICWNVQRVMATGVRLARRDDKVKITGREEIFRWQDTDGSWKQVKQLILDSFELVQPKVRFEVP